MDAKAPFHAKQGNHFTGPSKSGGWLPDRCDQIALIFQGGGALGAYQAGVYEALHEANIEPDWVTGVSIGAINAAIIAGNPRSERLENYAPSGRRLPIGMSGPIRPTATSIAAPAMPRAP